ncbi:MAG TPA: potassium transporter Kup [Polyangia bacterium]|nr:potassium transporter Kup [Polyangia bacterium]
MTSVSPPATSAHPRSHAGGDLAKLALGAVGVVYGDIGTSPLYALKECFAPTHGVTPTPANVTGILSLVLWSITVVVTVKYLMFVMRADNAGEGGVIALMSLLSGDDDAAPRRRRTAALVTLGLVGASLLSGEGVITPAISVLSAVEGLGIATNAFEPFVVPITCGILVALFLIQRRGTAGLGALFGPLTLCWFVSIAAAGVPWIARRPEVLASLNPLQAIRFLRAHGRHGFLVLGAVVLCITGCEALYADMGHFGKRAIRLAWVACVFPALALSYLGQGAMLLERPEAVLNPFFSLVPTHLLYPMVGIATGAAVVASQALISGAFSLVRQAVQLGYLPRVTIVHTSGKAEGQIYVPEVNAALMVACLALVVGFKSSSNLAAAYGIAVTGTMSITSVLFFFVARERWNWPLAKAALLVALFLTFDLSFFAACSTKLASGGWFPVTLALVTFTVMKTWKRGRDLLAANISAASLPLEAFLEDVALTRPHRVRGTAVVMSSIRRGTPNVLLHHFKHNQVLHEQVVILSIVTDAVPEVAPEESIHLRDFGQGFWAVTAHYGFAETPDVMNALRRCRPRGLVVDEARTSFFLGRETLVGGAGRGMATWRRRLFAYLSRNARPATDFFALPPNRVVEIGAQIEL